MNETTKELPNRREMLITLGAGVFVVVVLLAIALFFNSIVGPRAVPGQLTPELQATKDNLMTRVHAAEATTTTEEDKQALFQDLLDQNNKIPFTPSEKQEVYKALRGF